MVFYKRPAFKVTVVCIITVIILAITLTSNPVKGYNIYQHPQHLLHSEQLKEPAKVLVIDNICGEQYVFNNAYEIAQVTAIIEDMQIAQKEISQARGGEPQSRYTISYYDDIKNHISEHRCTINVAPVWTENNVKPSYRFKLINEKETLKRLEELLTGRKAAYDVETLMRNKTQYIGNNSKVAALINALPLPEGVTRGAIELSTSNDPYGVTINYTLNDDSIQIREEQFLRNSVLLFALIDNAQVVTHIGYWNAKELSSLPFRFTHTRADAERIVGGDVRQFADSHENLAELIAVVQLLREDKTTITLEESPTDISIDHFEYPSTWPNLEILYGNKQLSWVRGDSNFTGEPGGVIGNTLFGMNEEHVDKMNSDTVEPGAELIFIADVVKGLNKPVFELQIMNQNNTFSPYPINQNTMFVPKKAGEYIFILSVDWGNGDNNILYWFKVLVTD